MGDGVQPRFDTIPSFLSAAVGDVEDLTPGQVALAGYFCDNLGRPAAGQRYLARQLRYASPPGDPPMNILDLGDVNVFPLEQEKHLAAVETQCRAVLLCGARLVLIGGDDSGAKALVSAAQDISGNDIHAVSATGKTAPSATSPVVLRVDLQDLAGHWLSQPRQLAGLAPTEMIARIAAVRGTILAAAVFGLAPALDSRGTTETRAALAILRAVTTRLKAQAH